MSFREISAFDVVHGQLDWPWITFDASGRSIAHASSSSTIVTRVLEGESVSEAAAFELPPDLHLAPPGDSRTGEPGRRAGLTAFSSASSASHPLLAVTGNAGDAPVLAILDPTGERKRVKVEVLLGEGHDVKAIAFHRAGRRLWLSAENATETVVALVDVASLEVVGVVRSASFPRPALHELHLHPQDDAVLLLAACGEEGSFARVVGFAGDVVSSIAGALDPGGIAAGFVGFSADGLRLYVAEADELRTHGWPTLDELSSAPLADDFVSSFSGAVLGDDILVDGEDAETHEDALMLFDRSALRGIVLPEAAPSGMWAGRLGSDALVTVDPKGDPARARVLVRVNADDLAVRRGLMS